MRERLGAPGDERKLAGGNLAWYYMTGPSGFETWRVVFGPGGTVTEYAQVLTAANFAWMREGATREEVLDRVGPPMERMSFWRTATETWTYRWLEVTFEMIAQPVFDAASGGGAVRRHLPRPGLLVDALGRAALGAAAFR